MVLYVEIKPTNCHRITRSILALRQVCLWRCAQRYMERKSAGIFGGDCLVRVSEPWGHGDVFFFLVIRATSIFEVGFLPFCVSTSICQEETLEKIRHHVDIVEVLLVGWAFLPFQSGRIPSPQHKLTGHVGGWCCFEFLFWRSPSILRQRNRNRTEIANHLFWFGTHAF